MAPVVTGRASGVNGTDSTSHSVTLPTGVATGELLVVVFSSDGAPTCSTASTGWMKVGQASDGTSAVTGAVFQKFATGSNSLSITTSASEQSSHVSFRISSGGVLVATSATGSSTNSNPPALTDIPDDHLWIATRSGDAAVQATVAPSGYGNLTTQTGGASGASTATAERTVSASTTEDPGTFTSSTEQWVSWTIGIVAKRTGNPLARWNTALTAAGSIRARWLAIGDSITEGQGASTKTNRWIDKALAGIRTTRGVSGGAGYVPGFYGTYASDSPWQSYSARSGTVSNDIWGANPGWRHITMSTSATQTWTVTGTHVEIWYLGNGGTFTWRVDGGSTTSVNTANGGVYATNLRTSVLSLGSAGSHTVTVAATTGPVYISGLVVFNGDSTAGVTLYDGGHTGHTSLDALGDVATNDPDQVATWTTIAPDLVSIELGFNDVPVPISPAQTVINLRQLIGDLRALPTSPSIVLIVGYTPDASNEGAAWLADHVPALRMLGAGDGTISVLDLAATMPAATLSGAGFYSTDGLHPNNSGHTEIANQFATLVTGGGGGGGGTNPTGPVGSWTMVFEDTFSGASLDLTRWSDTDGFAINGVTTQASNIAVTGGELVLTLSDSTHGAAVSSAPFHGAGVNGFVLDVGMVAEARVRFPGNGTNLYNWPAWWTSGEDWPADGEHDIAEVLGESGGVLTVNYHYGTLASPQSANQRPNPAGYWGGAYHIYTLHRKATTADVYWDGQLVHSYSTSDTGAGQTLLLNIGVGAGPTQTGSTGALRVDYVRAWQPT